MADGILARSQEQAALAAVLPRKVTAELARIW